MEPSTAFWFATIGNVLFIGIAWGDLRAQVRGLSAKMIEQKQEMEKLEDRLHTLELRPMAKRAGGPA